MGRKRERKKSTIWVLPYDMSNVALGERDWPKPICIRIRSDKARYRARRKVDEGKGLMGINMDMGTPRRDSGRSGAVINVATGDLEARPPGAVTAQQGRSRVIRPREWHTERARGVPSRLLEAERRSERGLATARGMCCERRAAKLIFIGRGDGTYERIGG